MTHRILLASGDDSLVSRVRDGLHGSGVELLTAGGAAEVPRLIDRERIVALVIDPRLEAGRGPELLERVAQARPELPVIWIAPEDRAADGLRGGALDFVDPEHVGLRLRTVLRNALTHARLTRRLGELVRDRRREAGFDGVVGATPGMLRAKRLMEAAAQKDVAALFVGEAGTGKRRAARALHVESARADRPFLAIPCGSLSPDRLGIELFGRQGERPGAFEEACGGTVFLEDVDRLGADAQHRLLEVLQASYVRRIGDTHSIPTNARVLASTTVRPEEWSASGVREDLQFRLAVYPIELPSLRDRQDDLELLALDHLRRFAERSGSGASTRFQPQALAAIAAHDWPNNLPELESAVERAALAADGAAIDVEHLPGSVREALATADDATDLRLLQRASSDPLADLATEDDVRPFEEQEQRILEHALKCTNWNVLETARRLRIGRATVYRKIERFGLRRSS